MKTRLIGMIGAVAALIVGLSGPRAGHASDIANTYGLLAVGAYAVDPDYSFTTPGGMYYHTWSGNNDVWNAGGVNFQSGASNIEVRVAGDVTLNTTADRNVNGYDSGIAFRILNGGVLRQTTGYQIFFGNEAKGIIDPGGTYRFQAAGGILNAGYAGLTVDGGIVVDLPATTDTATITRAGGPTPQFRGATVNVLKGNLMMALGCTVSNSTFNVSGPGTLQLDNSTGTSAMTWSNVVVTGTGVGKLIGAAKLNVSGPLTLNLTDGTTSPSGGGFTWSAGGFGGLVAGASLTNLGKFVFTATGTDLTHQMVGLPFISNGGLVLHNSGGDWYQSSQGLMLTNGAQYRFLVNDGRILLHNNGSLSVASGTTLAVDHSGTSIISDYRRDGILLYGNGIDIRDGANVKVTNGGTLVLRADHGQQVRFNGVAPTANLGFNAQMLNGGHLVVDDTVFITNVNSGATLDMRGAGASFQRYSDNADLISNHLAVVNGSLFVGKGYTLTPTNNALRIGSTGLVGGDGLIAGTTTVNGGTLSPGFSPGTIEFGGLTLTNNATYLYEGSDLVKVDNALTLNDNWILKLSQNGRIVNGGSLTLFTYGSLTPGWDSVPTFDFTQLGFTPDSYSLAQVGNSIVLYGLTAVPEPAILLLLGAGGLLLWRARRQR